MADPVNPVGREPMYYTKEFAFMKMEVDLVSKYSILYLYSSGMFCFFCILSAIIVYCI